ncbi:MAG: BrnT family toxin [Termitinemataceae bacterium]|nr:MAG: BrnT family toxin [Termitinemataceae bacterium]
MEFEWSSKKEEANLREHHLSLDTGTLVFNDPFRKVRHDDDSSYGEERYQTLGLVGKVLFVVYTENGEKIRMISARLADPKERRIYYGTNNKNTFGWSEANR